MTFPKRSPELVKHKMIWNSKQRKYDIYLKFVDVEIFGECDEFFQNQKINMVLPLSASFRETLTDYIE